MRHKNLNMHINSGWSSQRSVILIGKWRDMKEVRCHDLSHAMEIGLCNFAWPVSTF